MINLSIKHGRTYDDARARLQHAVDEITGKFPMLVSGVEWSPLRDRVKFTGSGMLIEMWLDLEHVHVSGDIPALSKIMQGPVVASLKGVLKNAFQKQLPQNK